jgi:kumamolisin
VNYSYKLVTIAIVASFLLSAQLARAQGYPPGAIVIPQSSIENPGDIGVRAHTNVGLVVPFTGLTAAQPGQVRSLGMAANPAEAEPLGPPFPGYFFETPASLGCIYKLVAPLVTGCDPNVVTAVPTGGSRAIAIVDAYDDPTALSDLQTFSTQFGLTPVSASNFQVIFATGTRPPKDPTGGWELEEALDTEWAHAWAPGAKIYLVEAASDSDTSLFAAEDVASNTVAAAKGGEVNNSWGSSEFSGETSYDTHLKKATVVYFAASGDTPGVDYPSASPFVVSAGGTSTTRKLPGGAFFEELAWQTGGGGVSAYEPRPSYQNAVSSIVGTHRGTPDVSSDAAINTPVWVYATSTGPLGTGWFDAYGTSVASITFAGIVNSAGNFFANTAAELTSIYSNRAVAADFRDITIGNCGPYGSVFAVTGYDLCTGVGSDQGKSGK